MSTCPHCGEEGFDGLDSDFHYCESCDELYDPSADGDGQEAWCPGCGDVRPVDEGGCCLRCGEDTDA